MRIKRRKKRQQRLMISVDSLKVIFARFNNINKAMQPVSIWERGKGGYLVLKSHVKLRILSEKGTSGTRVDDRQDRSPQAIGTLLRLPFVSLMCNHGLILLIMRFSYRSRFLRY
ncbi:hypothetical protein AVEN_53658-1 [Araneus ventricosus]|uniref:Uncharacterized protein n=1 Tax=Araneus ventricosus TaxID=182803 RepID=A0A4Y2MLI0_ARAVE|nr:hypothetical protein AVEN_53658-1 [Araneus ventricosus]